MKLCLVSESFLPTIGGAEVAVHCLASEFCRQGIETTVLTESSNRVNNFSSLYKVQHFLHTPRNILKGPLFALRLLMLQRKHQFDIIHFHKAYMAYYALKISTLLGAKIVITGHGGDIQVCPEINYGGRLKPGWHKKIAYAVRRADLLTAIGKGTRDTYLELGADQEKIIDIANGANLGRFAKGRATLRKAIGFGDEEKVVLSIGRYNLAKDQETLVRAMSLVQKHNNTIRCVFIGKKLEVLNPLIDELNLQKTVILVDQQDFEAKIDNTIDPEKIPNEFILSAYKSSDLYVSSSIIEGFPLTLVEAMAAGLPIVATNVWGNEDAVNDGENGLLVPAKSPDEMAKAIIHLFDNKEQRLAMAESSKHESLKYDWKNIASQYLAAYKKLLTVVK